MKLKAFICNRGLRFKCLSVRKGANLNVLSIMSSPYCQRSALVSYNRLTIRNWMLWNHTFTPPWKMTCFSFWRLSNDSWRLKWSESTQMIKGQGSVKKVNFGTDTYFHWGRWCKRESFRRQQWMSWSRRWRRCSCPRWASRRCRTWGWCPFGRWWRAFLLPHLSSSEASWTQQVDLVKVLERMDVKFKVRHRFFNVKIGKSAKTIGIDSCTMQAAVELHMARHLRGATYLSSERKWNIHYHFTCNFLSFDPLIK